MTELSPAAQAVLDAASNRWLDVDDDIPAQVAAAALRTAAQTLAYEIHCSGEGWYELVIDANDLYAIAAELEGSND